MDQPLRPGRRRYPAQPRQARHRLVPHEQQRILLVPWGDVGRVPEAAAHDIEAGETQRREALRPVLRPLLIEMPRATLTRDRRGEEHRRRRRGSAGSTGKGMEPNTMLAASATAGSVRLKLLKVAAQVRVSVRRVYVQLNSAYLWQDLFRLCHRRLLALGSASG